ncbi:MAG: beta strand repeat-containing protein [Lacipirellulaceae bacterium]
MSTLTTLRRKARHAARFRAAAFAAFLAIVSAAAPTAVFAIDWDDAGNDPSKLWDDNGNWNPDGDPDGLAVNIGNLANAANDRTLVDRAYSIDSLTVTGGADVVNSTDDGATNDWELLVNGATSVTGAGSSIVIYGGDPDGLDTATLTLGAGGSLFVNSTTASGLAVVEVDSGMFDVQAGGTLSGAGRIDLEDAVAVATVLLRNDGTITANTGSSLVFVAPAAGTLQLTATSTNARFDWDGTFGGGILEANGNQTLDIDLDVSGDAFDGTIDLATGSTIDVAGPWSLGGGMINANTAAFGLIIIGQDPNPGAAARIAGGAWSMNGGTITIDDTWDSLQFDSAVTATGGTINNEGTMIFNAAATFGVGSDFNMTGAGAALVVNSTVNIDTPDFNLDGLGLSGNVTTVNAGGNLDLDLGVGADEDFDHTINLNGGELDVTTTDNTWSLTSVGNLNAAGGVTSTVNGETFDVNGDVAISGNSTLDINATTVFGSTAGVVVDAGSTLDLAFSTFNGGSYTGAGVLEKGTATIASSTTWATGTVDIDDGSTTVQNGATLTVATGAIDSTGDGIDANVTVANTGALSLGLTGGGDVVFDSLGSLIYNGDATQNTFLLNPASGSAVRFDAGAEFDVNGDGAAGARVKLNGTLNINTAGGSLRMVGGTLAAGDTNEIAGGTINGPGELEINGAEALRGFGTINAAVDGDGNAQLIASGGTLNVNGAILDIGTVGTSGAAGVLDVTNPWNTNVANLVVLDGGTVQGSTITNDGAGFRGQGTIAARVVNNTSIISTTPGVLIANNVTSDWDGAGNVGVLRATQGTLELVDNAPFVFSGTVQADGGTVFVNGFGLEFEPASQLVLSSGAYRTNAGSLIGGAVNVIGGTPSTIESTATVTFEGSSSTTLAANLRLDNATTAVQAGATFAGAGDLVNLVGRQLNLADTSNVGVQVTNFGLLDVAGGAAGRTDVLDYQQNASGATNLDVAGLGVGSFDRLVTSGIAQLDGVLNVITGVAQPLGSSIQAITATGGVIGTFDAVNSLGVALGAGLQWQAVYNPTSVNLVVGLVLPGDYNNDGVVNAADYTVWADNLGTATNLPGDPTPGAVSQSDYDVWVANYGAVAAASSMGMAMATSVPEPTGLVLLALAGVAVTPRRRMA